VTSSNERFDENTRSTAEVGDPFAEVHEAPQETAAPTEAEPILQDGPADADVAGQPQDADVAVDEPVEPERELAEETPTDLVAELAATKQALAERTTDLQRLQAEYVNYKRRVDRDRELVRQNATFQVLTGLLPVLDDIDRAREHGELEGGFKAVADSLERTVAALGLEKYGEPGDEFDPNLHEALMHSHSPDVTTTTCQTIVHAGYRIGDRVVRPARVTVVDPEPAGEA
jgi:molecular chaperone GrpE